MKSFRLVAVTVVCLFALTAAVSAQEPGAVKKIAIMDLSKVFDSFQKTKEYDTVLEGKTKEYETERNAKIDKIKELQNKLALLKDDEKEKVNKELETMKADLIAFDQAKRTDLTKQRDEKIREILLEIEKVVSDYAKQEKYDLILNDRVLIYGDQGLDISTKILELLNAEYNKKK